MQKILEIQGESYQNHFDNLRDKIYEKVDVTPQETILLADFIQTHNLDESVALNNITPRYAKLLTLKLWKLDALEDIGISIYSDLTVTNKIIKHDRLNGTNLKELVQRAVNEDIRLSTACKRMAEELEENIILHLTYEAEVYNMVDVEGVI